MSTRDAQLHDLGRQLRDSFTLLELCRRFLAELPVKWGAMPAEQRRQADRLQTEIVAFLAHKESGNADQANS